MQVAYLFYFCRPWSSWLRRQSAAASNHWDLGKRSAVCWNVSLVAFFWKVLLKSLLLGCVYSILWTASNPFLDNQQGVGVAESASYQQRDEEGTATFY